MWDRRSSFRRSVSSALSGDRCGITQHEVAERVDRPTAGRPPWPARRRASGIVRAACASASLPSSTTTRSGCSVRRNAWSQHVPGGEEHALDAVHVLVERDARLARQVQRLAAALVAVRRRRGTRRSTCRAGPRRRARAVRPRERDLRQRHGRDRSARPCSCRPPGASRRARSRARTRRRAGRRKAPRGAAAGAGRGVARVSCRSGGRVGVRFMRWARRSRPAASSARALRRRLSATNSTSAAIASANHWIA